MLNEVHEDNDGIARPCKKRGRRVCGFNAYSDTANAAYLANKNGWFKHAQGGGANITVANATNNYTGIDAAGAITGIRSQTGTAAMLRLAWAGASDFTLNNDLTVGTKNGGVGEFLNGLVGVWVFIEGYVSGNIKLSVQSWWQPAQNEATYTSNYLTSGWNFLVFARKANPTSDGDVEAHPFGLVESIGTGGNISQAAWVTNRTNLISIRFENLVCTAMYLDSIWTDWETTPQFCIGADSSGTYTESVMLPKFNAYGWKGYIAEPFRVGNGADTIEVTDFNSYAGNGVTGSTQYLDMAYAAGWDIINHTINHPDMDNTTTPQGIYYELTAAKAWQLSLGYSRGNDYYAGPRGRYSSVTITALRNLGFVAQRDGIGGINQITPFTKTPIAGDNMLIRALDVGGNAWLYGTGAPWQASGIADINNIRTFVDMAIKYKSTACIFVHAITSIGDNGLGTGNSGSSVIMYKSTWDLMCDYIREKELAGLCEVVSMTKLLTGKD